MPTINLPLIADTTHVDGVIEGAYGLMVSEDPAPASAPTALEPPSDDDASSLRWTGLDGKLPERDFAGMWATCAQHELDHLNGKLFIDHIGPMKRQMITRKMVKLKRELDRERA